MAFTTKDWKDYPDTSTPITAAALEDLETRVTDYGNTYVTALPSSPIDGQEIYYAADATNGIIWHFRYRSGSSSSYKWEFVGGSQLAAYNATHVRRAANSSTYGELTDPANGEAVLSVSLTIPLAGDYDITISADMLQDQTYCNGYGSYSVGGTAAADDWAIQVFVGNRTDEWETHSRTHRHTGVSASSAVTYKAKSPDNSIHYADNRRLAVIPVRVG